MTPTYVASIDPCDHQEGSCWISSGTRSSLCKPHDSLQAFRFLNLAASVDLQLGNRRKEHQAHLGGKRCIARCQHITMHPYSFLSRLMRAQVLGGALLKDSY